MTVLSKEFEMQFEPDIHTKEYLLSNIDTLRYLASVSDEFAQSELAADYEILNTSIKDEGRKVAHFLASRKQWLKQNLHQDINILKISDADGKMVAHLLVNDRDWALTPAAKTFDVLNLRDKHGYSVAHYLSEYASWLDSDCSKKSEILDLRTHHGWSVAHHLASHAQWLQSAAASDLEILRKKNVIGITVAHSLAKDQPKWMLSKAANDVGILLWSDDDGRPVAKELIKHVECLKHVPLFDKQVLSCESKGKLIAEYIAEKYGKVSGFNLTDLAMKLVLQGAAFKHSLDNKDFLDPSIYEKIEIQMSECLEPLVALKIAQALFSTCHHEMERAKSIGDDESIYKQWLEVSMKAETLMRVHLANNPYLLDLEHSVDIFCEPSDVLLKRIYAEKQFEFAPASPCNLDESSTLTNSLY
jgi:hypothetical protein